MHSQRPLAQVITVSDRSSRGEREDRSGPEAVRLLDDAGWDTRRRVVADDAGAVSDAIRSAVGDGARLVVTSGGTGVGPRDVTPEATAPLLRLILPGVAERVRAAGSETVPAAMLSRGLAGISGEALVVNLAGSIGAVRDGVPVVASIAAHVLEQLDGEDHQEHEPGEEGHR